MCRKALNFDALTFKRNYKLIKRAYFKENKINKQGYVTNNIFLRTACSEIVCELCLGMLTIQLSTKVRRGRYHSFRSYSYIVKIFHASSYGISLLSARELCGCWLKFPARYNLEVLNIT